MLQESRDVVIDAAHAAFAREWIARSDQAGKVEVREGDAADELAKLPDGAADAVFVDADKTGYVTYLRHALRILRVGGVLMADNVLAGGDIATGTSEKAVALRAFLDAADASDALQSVVVPLGDGIFFGVKLG